MTNNIPPGESGLGDGEEKRSGTVVAHKDDGDDVEIPYERREDGVWYVMHPDEPIGMVRPGAHRFDVEQLIRKKHDDNY